LLGKAGVMDTLVVRVEEGSLSYESHSGDWLTETGLDYLISVFGDEIGPALEMESEADMAVKMSKADSTRVFLVTINDLHWVHDEGYWNMDYGYVNAESHLEWNGQVEVREL
jgi:hypothetical protein